MGHRVRRPEDDAGAAQPSHPPLPHPRNRKRQLPLQEQLGETRQTHQGENAKLDEPLTLKPSSSRVSSQWKSWVSSRRKSTVRVFFDRRTPVFLPFTRREAQRDPRACARGEIGRA